MYTREQATQLKHEFWTTFGKYIAPHPSAEGTKVNWINYKTGVKHIYFRMAADQKQAKISIVLSHPDMEMQLQHFEQFVALKLAFQEAMQEEWQWQYLQEDDNGRTHSLIEKEIGQVNILNNNDWPKLISFFKPRIIALDEFWSNAKYTFI